MDSIIEGGGEDQPGSQSVPSEDVEMIAYDQEKLEEIENFLHLLFERAMAHQSTEGRTRMKREALDSFTTFYLPKYGSRADTRFKRDLLKTFSTFYLPASGKEGSQREKRSVLKMFSNLFSADPQHVNEAGNDRNRRSILESFSTFSSPRMTPNTRSKRNTLDSLSSFYRPKIHDSQRSKRNVLESFNGFYFPKGKKDILDTLSSFYKSGPRNKRHVAALIPVVEEIDSMPSYEVDEDVPEADRNKREILEPFTSFYKVRNNKANDRSKRDARLGSLGSFTSFYLPKAFGIKDKLAQDRSKRSPTEAESNENAETDVESGPMESLDFDTPPRSENLMGNRGDDFLFMNPAKRNPPPLNTFSSFYTPKGKLNRFRRGILRSFAGFYLPASAHDDYHF